MTRRLLVVGTALLALAPAARAASAGPVFGLRAVGNPRLGYFVYDLRPGATTTGALIVSNVGGRAGTARLYAVDATTGTTTGTVYGDGPPTRQGTWISIARPRVRLAAGAHVRVPFTVHVPRGAKPGEWVAGLVAENATAVSSRRTTKAKAGVQINIRNRTIVAVQVNVPGTLVASFRVGAVTPGGSNGYQQVAVHIANTGNVLRKPAGRLTILHGATPIETLPFRMDTFLPQTAIDYPVLLKKALAPGSYAARVTLTYASATGAARTTTASPSFTVSSQSVAQVFTSAAPTQRPPAAAAASGRSSSSTPWALVGAIAAAAVLLALLLLALLRRRRRGAPLVAAAPEEPPAQDDAAPAVEPSPEPPHAQAPAVPAAQPSSEQPGPGPDEQPPAVRDEQPPVARDAAAPAASSPERPAAPPSRTVCAHYWDVAYDRGNLGDDGVWRFPHRCRYCGIEVPAANIEDASAQASSAAQPAST